MTHPLIVCDCGIVVLTCACLALHPVRLVPCCGTCTATGADPDLDALEGLEPSVITTPEEP
jgi:hypothetical protein